MRDFCGKVYADKICRQKNSIFASGDIYRLISMTAGWREVLCAEAISHERHERGLEAVQLPHVSKFEK